ncbi:MAG: hypothetical protein V4579_08460 [Pseudomonadota bacterium]
MSEFMLIQPGGVQRMWPPSPSSNDPDAILLRLLACLRDLDRVDARLAAAYLESAIHHFRAQFDLDRNSSETD